MFLPAFSEHQQFSFFISVLFFDLIYPFPSPQANVAFFGTLDNRLQREYAELSASQKQQAMDFEVQHNNVLDSLVKEKELDKVFMVMMVMDKMVS